MSTAVPSSSSASSSPPGQVAASMIPLGTASRADRALRLDRVLPAPPAVIWAAWTDPEVLPTWFGPVLEGAPGPDLRYVLEGRGQHGDTIVCSVRVWEPARVLEHTWRYTGETDSVVRWELSDAGDGATQLVLTHREFGEEADPVDYAAGWHMYTDCLHATLTGTPGPVDTDARWRGLMPIYAEGS